MTPEKTKKAFADCILLLLSYSFNLEPIQFPASKHPRLPTELLRHAYWMCIEGQKLIDQNRIEKAKHWLGFVQGVMFSTLHITIDDMKHINMPKTDEEALGTKGPES